MTLRLVLVSLVAAMGLTIPSAPVIESWVASTQNWMNARFADWDTRNPQTADYVIVSDYYDVERLAPRPALSSLPATAPEPSDRPGLPKASSATFSSKPALLEDTRTAAVRPVSFVRQRRSFEPIWVGEQLSLGIAYELNLKNEGTGVVPPKVVRKPAAAVRFDPKPVVKKVYREVQLELAQWSRTLGSVLPRVVFPAASPRRIEPVVVAKNPGGGADKLIQQSRGIGINPPVASAPRPVVTSPARPALASQTSFGPMETSASLYFAGDLTPPAKSVLPTPRREPTKPSATPVAVRPPLSLPATETRELPDDLDIEVAGELVREDDGFGAPARAAKAPVTAATPRFEPLEVSCDYYMGTAFELNFRNDGLSIPAESAVETAKTDVPAPHSGRDLSRAVKLTRDAVYAWVNVFTGPALVTVSQSN
ncbi:MAG: hypothetical protein ABSH35_17295 [Isosphaeraceae bacterium]|jgi:hypothetical protein